MSNELLTAILAGLGGMLGWGVGDFFVKKTVDHLGAIRSLVWAHIFGTIIFILAAAAQILIFNNSVPLPAGWAWAGLVFFGSLQMLVYWLVYEGFGKGQVAVLSPVFASFPGIVAIVSFLAFGEQLTPLKALSLVLIFGGVILLNVDLSSLKQKKSKRFNVLAGFKEVFIAALLAAIWTILWDRFIGGKDALSYAMFMYIFMTIAACLLAMTTKSKLKGVMPSIWKFLVLIGLCEAIAYLTISWGYSSTSLTSVVALVSGAFSLPTIVLAKIYLKEEITRTQVVAIALTICGIGLIALT
jgi:drug/metabolite transporter (DMT)-like permease